MSWARSGSVPSAPLRRPTTSRRHEETILKDIVELADRYDTPIRTALRVDIAPEDAILRQARLGHYDLVVMGVGRPAGEALFRQDRGGGARSLATLDPVRVELTRISSAPFWFDRTFGGGGG
jgi:nucleotide-binding universal stress UspA family protein